MGNGTDVPCSPDATNAVAYQSSSPPASDLQHKANRLETLKDWPFEYLDPELVARNGFYYFGKGVNLRCFFCGVVCNDWGKCGGNVDGLESAHARWSEVCPLILGMPEDNVPTSDIDEIGASGREIRPHNRYYMSGVARLNSFKGWPIRMHQRPAKMVEAGLYYTGVGDQVKCFSCGGGLKDWEDSDDPLEEHVRFFGRCPFILAIGKQSETGLRPAKPVSSRIENPTAESLQKENEDESIKLETEVSTKEEEHNTSTKTEDFKESESPKGFEEVCKICCGAEANIAFIPCGHVVACLECGSKMTVCPVCRQTSNTIVILIYPRN